MSWGGFSNYSNNASAYLSRGGYLSSSYGRGGYRGGVAGGQGYGGGGAGFGLSYGSGGPSSLAYRTSNYSSSNAANPGTGTARVAVIGATQAAFKNWWAIHAAGFQVSVVVGVDDVRSGSADGQATGAVASEGELKASAETARAFAVRCTEFYHLPCKAASASATTSAAAKPAPKVSTHSAASSPPSTDVAGAATSAADVKRGDVMEVRVRVSDEPASEQPSTPTTATTTATATRARTASLNVTSQPGGVESNKDSQPGSCITATAWHYFLKPFLHPQKSVTEEKISTSSSSFPKGVGGSNWSTQPGKPDSRSSSVSAAPATSPLIDDVEVIFVTSLQSNNAGACDEVGLRAALVWLISKGKHLVVDCVLSCETVAACAAAAATVTRGKEEMHRIFLYRGGGVRYGWSTAAMTHLRKALAVHRGTGQASKGTKAQQEKPESASVTTTGAALATAKASEADDAFSIFDFMGGSSNLLGGASKGADIHSSNRDGSTSADVGEKQAEEKPKAKSVVPIVTSLAVDAESGVTGALQHLRFTVRGSGLGRGGHHEMPFAASLGVMDTLGWDAVAWVLHLLDWTCPDMVQGRVVRRAAITHDPLCVEAALYYGIDGTVDEDTEGEGDKGADGGGGHQRVARPQYLRVLLHIGAGSGVRADTGAVEASPSVFQQCLRAVGTKAVVTVAHPLLPPPSQTCTALGSAAERESPPPSAAFGASPFKVTTTRTMDVGAAANAPAAATSSPLPAVPSIAYSYVVTTQDALPGTLQRVRRDQTVAIPSTEGGPCVEARLWQHVRGQLSVTTSTVASSPMGTSDMGGGYQGYGSRYATRGRYGANIGLGTAGGYYGRGRGGLQGYGGGFGAASPPSSSSASAQTVVKAELTMSDVAALDVQRAWLVQMVVERILDSARPSEARHTD
ncbi:hypothetical protein ABL78_2547 [Leptomonas seymouri]|uniref:Uncharacterized protein n=1 Tax=Leptomonas seymouri TaxID=5684 RepID=A0A0N1I942_LEPSE|nr:hypothetical protein ABL78_2547 [Leptomonas seymouri]|eukprot:KPI88372.1 hypothetical protein ABL78_2547 [Leptomonas seymouri]